MHSNDDIYINLYITVIKQSYRQLITDYKWFKKLYNKHWDSFIFNTKNQEKLFIKRLPDYVLNIKYIFSLIEKPLLDLDFEEIAKEYLKRYNLTIKDIVQMYKNVITCPRITSYGNSAKCIYKRRIIRNGESVQK